MRRAADRAVQRCCHDPAGEQMLDLRQLDVNFL
jgi:hypothetical protein